MEKKKTLIFSGGGSGGHVIPAITLIKEIKKLYPNDYEILYVGSAKQIEQKLTEKEGIAFHAISTGKLRRYISLENLLDMFRIVKGVFQCFILLFRYNRKNTLVFSTGGFVSVPLAFAAWLHRIPLIIHEQTSRMGLANKISSYFAKKILISFKESSLYLPANKTFFSGYPVRREFFTNEQKPLLLKGRDLSSLNYPILFITGGGNGSFLLNEKVKAALPELLKEFVVVHQVGATYKKEFELLENENYISLDFIGDEFIDLMKKASIIVSRSGAGTVCELMSLGKASIFIPLKIAQKNEQYYNAMSAHEALGSMVISEEDFKKKDFLTILNEFKKIKNKVLPMPSSTQSIDIIIDQIRKI